LGVRVLVDQADGGHRRVLDHDPVEPGEAEVGPRLALHGGAMVREFRQTGWVIPFTYGKVLLSARATFQ